MIRTCLCLVFLVSLSVQAENYSLVVQGLGGTPEYEKAFSVDSKAIAAAAALSSESPAHNIFLGGAQATRETFVQKIDDLVRTMNADDSFSLTLVGHGSFDGNEFKFNLPGADLSGQELLGVLGKIPARRQLVVIASSSSGAMLERLTVDGRTVVTATRSGRENNAVSFSRHWAGALVSGSADTNKDELLSATEAFRFSEKKIEEHYKSENLLASEHPRMIKNDNSEFYLARTGKLTGSEKNPRIASLLEKRIQFAEKFYSLRNRKTELPEKEYLDSLQEIMLQMARLQIFIDTELDSMGKADEDS